MSKKKNKKPIIHLVGNNATEVTGSMILVTTTKGTQMLLECGAVQGGTLEEDYRINYNAFNQVNLDKISYCFLLHNHCDHFLQTPRAVSLGMKGKIITNSITAKLMKPMLSDGAFIAERNAEFLTKKYDRNFAPLFTENDIDNMLNNTYEYDFDMIHKLDDEISFKLLKNSHVPGASSLELYIKDESGYQYKIFYSSDLGNTAIPNRPYLSEVEYCRNANLAIFESTYGNRDKQVTKKDRKLEEKLIKDKIIEHCLNENGTVIIPCFSFARSQEIMTLLYDDFKNDKRFDDIPFIVDSRLTKQVNKVYTQILEEEDEKRFNEVLKWKNLKVISDFKKETSRVLNNNSKKVIISSSGFADYGHIKEYIKKYIESKNNLIIFCGYASEKSLAGKLRKDIKTISIDKKSYKKMAEVIVLESFSSHMQKKQLVDYITAINTEKVILVHGDKDSKESLKKAIEEKLSKVNKTTNIIVGKKNLKVSL